MPDPLDARDLRDAALFYGLTVAMAIGVAWLARHPDGGRWLVLFMFTPLVAVLLTRLITQRALRLGSDGLGLTRPGFAAWPFALLIPPVLLGLVTLAAMATGLVWIELPAGTGSVTAAAMGFVAGFAVNCVFAFGEEIGWRGFLISRLQGLGPWLAMTVTGALHAVWHLPAILMTPHYHGDGTPWLIVPGFLVVLTLAGVPYGFVRLRTGSVWPAVLMHAMFNSVLFGTENIVRAVDPAMPGYLGGESGIFSIIALVILAFGLARFWCPSPQAAASTR